MHNDIERVLLTEEQLHNRIAELGRQLTEEYDGKNPVFLGVLKGVIMFYADMIRAIPILSQIEFMGVSSYGSGTKSSGHVQVTKDISISLEGRHVIILEDIIDSGVTLKFMKEYLEFRNPASLKICTLLDKPARRKADITADYVGFTIPDEFVVGYGLDYDEQYRNLPYVGVLKPEVYNR